MHSILFLITSLLSLSPTEGNEIPHYWLPEIVVTAKRIKEPLADVAIDMKVISEEEITRKGVRSLADLLNEEAFLDVRTTGIEGGLLTVGLRGFPSDQLLVLLNGIALNSPANGSFDFSEIPLSSIKRIEIVKSPSSSLYGANASSGVINIITEKLREDTYYELNGDISDKGGKHISGEASHGNEIFKTHLSISKRTGEGERPNCNFNSLHGAASLFILKSITGQFSAGERTVGVPGPIPSPAYIPAYGDSIVYSLFDNQKTHHRSGTVQYRKMFAHFTITSKLGYRKEDLWFSQMYQGFREDWSVYKASDEWFYATEQLSGSFQCSFRDLSLGVDVINQEFWAYDSLFDKDRDSLVSTLSWNPIRKNKGFWSSGKLHFFNNRIIPSASIRWDKNNDYSNFLSYSLGLLVKPERSLRVGSSLGRGFRPPTFNELYWPGAGNPELKPQESLQANTYVDYTIKEMVFLRVSGFWRNVKNSISWINFSPRNIDKLTVQGVEINPRFHPIDPLTFSVTLVAKRTKEERLNQDTSYHWYIDGVHLKERRAPFTPEIKFSSSLEWDIRENTTCALSSIYTGERIAYFFDFVDSEYKIKHIAPITLYNFCLTQQIGGSFFISLRVNNIFDTKNISNFGYTLDDKDYPAPGRVISLGVRLKG